MPLLLKNDRKAQYELYMGLAPRLKGVAKRYFKDEEEINDLLQDTFINIFASIHLFRGDSKIETWATRILINNILQRINKNKKYDFTELEAQPLENLGSFSETDSNLLYEELIQLINQLPESKKIIFNLYVIDGYAHKEIAEMLGVTESTSKTQLFRAKEILVELHHKINHVRKTA